MTSLTESKTARVSTLCALYFAQGFPWGFMTTALVAYLAKQGLTVADTGYGNPAMDIQAHLGATHRLFQLSCHGPPSSLDHFCRDYDGAHPYCTFLKGRYSQ